jgi:GDP-L-fucose synthase
MLLVTGHKGLLGSKIIELDKNALTLDFRLDKSDSEDKLTNFILKNKITHVIHCAARVGGVKSNIKYNADFLNENLKINLSIINSCKNTNVKLLSLLSTCIYPDSSYINYPLTESQLHNGPPHNSNYGYAYAKRILQIQSESYRNQFGCNFITVIINNMYGEGDNFSIDDGHVIPSLIRKIYESKINNNTIKIWGNGEPLREFTYAMDAAKCILWILYNYNSSIPINIGNNNEISIKELVIKIKNIIKCDSKVEYDISMPNGQFKKPMSIDYLNSLGYSGSWTNIDDGLDKTINWFKLNYPNVRGIK